MTLPLGAAAAGSGRSDVIDLRVPADPAYLAVVRTATAGVATRLDLTLDEIEDLRIAVDEACALLLQPDSRSGDRSCSGEGWLHALFTVDADPAPGSRIEVRITGPHSSAQLDTGYSWMLLQALVDDVASGQDASGRWITLTRTGKRTS